MTTSQSPLKALRAQADLIASTIKAAERGERIDVRFAAKLLEARDKPSLKVAVAMDDKLVTIEMPWATIKETSQVALGEFILREMQGKRGLDS